MHPKSIYTRTETYREEQAALAKSAIQFTIPIIENYSKKTANLSNNNNFNKLNENSQNQKSIMRDLHNSNLSAEEIVDEVKTLVVAVSKILGFNLKIL